MRPRPAKFEKTAEIRLDILPRKGLSSADPLSCVMADEHAAVLIGSLVSWSILRTTAVRFSPARASST
jgi:hypothetical protein